VDRFQSIGRDGSDFEFREEVDLIRYSTIVFLHHDLIHEIAIHNKRYYWREVLEMIGITI
jgi:hypothetical protein